MKKTLCILLIAVMTITLIACTEEEKATDKSSEDVSISEPVIDAPETPDSVDEPDVTTNPEEALPPKPQNSSEIIALADSMEVDTSLTAFTLDGILEDTQLKASEDAGDEYQNTTAYLGDSVSLGLGVFGNHPKEMVIAKGSINPMDAVEKNLITLDDGTSVNFPTALSMLDAKRAVLTFGANAISVMSEETFLNYYIKLIHAVREKNPDCEIIIQSISPIATTCTLKKFTNVLINRANLLLLILAYSEDAYFLNSAPALKGDDGYLKLEYCSSDDGIHINELGYRVWIDFLRTHPIV